ncbi:MAG TPA: chemotaxis protein CheW [Anaeromyxobacter sp.]
MDFLKIRKKARERAAGREATGPRAATGATATPTPVRTPTATATATAAPAPAPAPDRAADAERRAAEELEGELAARLVGPPAVDEGFTTWRPGTGPAPRLVEFVPPAQELPEPSSEDFALVTRPSGSAPLAASPLPTLPPPPAVPGRSASRAPLDEFFYRPDEETPELPELGASAAPAPEDDAEAAVREEYLTFLLGREEYAVAIERVREVVRAPPVTEVPRAPAHVLGVVTVRGEVMAVLDPRRRLGLPGTAPLDGAGRIVIVDAGDGACALLVDAVSSVVRLPAGAIEPCPQGIGGPRAEFLAGIGREGDRLFTVLDLGALLRRAAAAGPQEGTRADR